MKFRQAKHQDQSARYSQHTPGESPAPCRWSSGDRFASGSARGFDSRIHEHWIGEFEDVVGPGRNHYLPIRYRWYPEYVESAIQQEQRRSMLGQLGVCTDPNK
jgi:hypothetical protein